MPASNTANRERFECIGVAADAKSAARAREEFTKWLDRFFVTDPFRANDIVLAVNEAMANAAEFAYELSDRPGTMDVQAAYDARDEKLTATVADRGAWRMSATSNHSHRGRGVPLMRAVADRAVIETSPEGTRVLLEWRDIQQN